MPPPRSPDAAANVIRLYYDAINAHDYSTAYQQWAGAGEASGKSFATFASGFAQTARSVVTIGGPGAIEGAAGSLYINVPVTIGAVRQDGRNERFTGSYTLRRVNDVDGSTVDQRRWHIASAAIRAAEKRP